jgi:hypothetical protein
MSGQDWEIGVDGLPVDPDHPFNRDRRTAEEWRQEIVERELRRMERAWGQGVTRALSDAVRFCHRSSVPPPVWVVQGIQAALAQYGGQHRRWGRLATPEERERQNRIHHERWDAVTELRERKDELAALGYHPSWQEAYVNASEKLAGTEAEGSPESMKKSYQLVERLMRSGKGARFYIP